MSLRALPLLALLVSARAAAEPVEDGLRALAERRFDDCARALAAVPAPVPPEIALARAVCEESRGERLVALGLYSATGTPQARRAAGRIRLSVGDVAGAAVELEAAGGTAELLVAARLRVALGEGERAVALLRRLLADGHRGAEVGEVWLEAIRAFAPEDRGDLVAASPAAVNAEAAVEVVADLSSRACSLPGERGGCRFVCGSPLLDVGRLRAARSALQGAAGVAAGAPALAARVALVDGDLLLGEIAATPPPRGAGVAAYVAFVRAVRGGLATVVASYERAVAAGLVAAGASRIVDAVELAEATVRCKAGGPIKPPRDLDHARLAAASMRELCVTRSLAGESVPWSGQPCPGLDRLPAVAVAVVMDLASIDPGVPSEAEALPFVGRFRERWPGIASAATHVVAWSEEGLAIDGWSPLVPRYQVSDITLRGGVLRFAEDTGGFTVLYEIAVTPDTLRVRARGREGWLDTVVWERD